MKQYTFAYTYNEKTIEYAKKLASVYPGGVKAKVCFGNCSSDTFLPESHIGNVYSSQFEGVQKYASFLL